MCKCGDKSLQDEIMCEKCLLEHLLKIDIQKYNEYIIRLLGFRKDIHYLSKFRVERKLLQINKYKEIKCPIDKLIVELSKVATKEDIDDIIYNTVYLNIPYAKKDLYKHNYDIKWNNNKKLWMIRHDDLFFSGKMGDICQFIIDNPLINNSRDIDQKFYYEESIKYKKFLETGILPEKVKKVKIEVEIDDQAIAEGEEQLEEFLNTK